MAKRTVRSGGHLFGTDLKCANLKRSRSRKHDRHEILAICEADWASHQDNPTQCKYPRNVYHEHRDSITSSGP